MTKEDFISKAISVHGEKYDYSQVNYVNNRTKVKIICPTHGTFEQRPSVHTIKGCGCPYCGNVPRYTTETFIKAARRVHGDKYDYSKVNFINGTTEVTIICPIHGEFQQKPIVHLNGSGCQKCAGNVKYTTETFIEAAKNVHGNKYDYSKVEYINSSTKVTIICPTHGEFQQLPSEHLQGKGCIHCAGKAKYTNETFIAAAREVHGEKYDYSKVNYINCMTEVTIICPIHGEFKQRPVSHLQGSGCQRCGGTMKYTKETFIEAARNIHGDKYDYSKVEYVDYNKKIIIICPKHGPFE